jgi:drug/metabolite transporter (DMT)-like permease
MQAVWVFLALVAALSAALRDVASKHAVRRASPLAVALGVAAVPAVLLGAIVLVTGALTGHPVRPDDGFWTALLVSGGINAIATPLIVLALQRSDLSLVAPLTSLTPLFMLATGVVVLGEWPGPRGVAGVAIIVAGAWLLALPAADEARTTTARSPSARPASARAASAGPTSAGPAAALTPVLARALDPVRALARDTGARAMLVVAFLYSISSTYDKVGTQASSPLAWAAAVNLVVTLVLAAILATRLLGVRGRPGSGAGPGIGARAPGPAGALTGEASRAREGQPAARPAAGPRAVVPAIVLAGLLAALMAAAQMTALLLTLAAYVIAVKRTSTLFAVLLGRSVFHEPRTRQRLAGAAIMLAGFLLVVLEG